MQKYYRTAFLIFIVTMLPIHFSIAAIVIAIGDIHGDFVAAKKALTLAGVLDTSGTKWVGNDAVVVQLGDRVDRGQDDRAVLDLFESLSLQAKQQGGDVVSLLGNHEIYNVSLDFWDNEITEKSFLDFFEFYKEDESDPRILKLPLKQRGRAVAFRPGGPYAIQIGKYPAIFRYGSDVFVHGGISSEYIDYGLDRINEELRNWILGMSGIRPLFLDDKRNPLQDRTYSKFDDESTVCPVLDKVLARIGATRMIVGHTPQKNGINSLCNGKVWRVDTGMSEFYCGNVEVLRFNPDGSVYILKEPPNKIAPD